MFGYIAEGLETLKRVEDSVTDQTKRPYQDIYIKHTYILEDGFTDPVGLIVPSSPSPLQNSDRLTEQDVQVAQVDPRQLHDTIKENEANTRAVVLEMLGDLPDANIKPPENVAFLCKLNRVTTDEDLFMIFSRFGPIKNCDIVKDWKTGGSLGYGFIEFENPRDCEEAVLRMDGASIDERRIKIDFSQSVSKLWHRRRSGRPSRCSKSRSRSP